MRFSVIIPCYNSSATIIQSMDSVVQQSFNDWEMIVVDDCSTDETVTNIQSLEFVFIVKKRIVVQAIAVI